MIVDAHAYCFPPLGEANGFPSAREHLRYVQREMADHHQPVWRLTDRAPGHNEMLADPRDRTLRGLREVGFRAGGHGRFLWTVDGHEYAKQYLPPALADLAHPPEMLVAQMDYAGVDRALLHTDHVMGELTDYLAACVRRYPTRLLALANLREWEIERDPGRRHGGGLARVRPRALRLSVHPDEPLPPRRHRSRGTDPRCARSGTTWRAWAGPCSSR